jgi:hypothetical protein
MARKDRKTSQEDRVTKTRANIQTAWRVLSRTILGPLAANVSLAECADMPGEPQLTCVDPAQGVVWFNPHTRHELKTPEWTFLLAHPLLHLGLDHAARRLDRDPRAWNLACEHAADNLLHTFKIGRAPHDFAVDTTFAGLREEEIYDLLIQDRRALATFKTPAGPNRSDLVSRRPVAPRPSYPGSQPRPRDYERLLAEGIRNGVDTALQETAETLGQTVVAHSYWRPAENARRWVMHHIPLLGALAAQLRIIADADLCERMDISIAAVNAYLGEIYLHKARGLTQEEWIFVYAHELLHVALLHHTRLQGRDPLL